jgi:malate synthase A
MTETDLPGREPSVLTADALAFVAELTRSFRSRLEVLLRARGERQLRLDDGESLDFPRETAAIRAADWTVGPAPADLQDRRVEITGPVDRKMIINAMNSGASCFMADFEDATSPTFANLVSGQENLVDCVRRTISHVAPESGRVYALDERTATLLVRPRGLHLVEAHVEVDQRPVPASLFDFGIFLFHNAAELVARGTGPYFYLPKLESRFEAGWWADVLATAEEMLGLEHGTIKVTVLIETITAAFEIDEILWTLRPHVVGLNCGRWDYIFSFINRHRAHRAFLIPDRVRVTMDQPFLRAYTRRVVEICHRRGAHAMGGMAAQIPLRDPIANEIAMTRVHADKLREVTDGHDGTWVAHPGLVPVAKAVFDAHMSGPNQIGRAMQHTLAGRDELLRVPEGSRTEAGLQQNIRVGIRYLESWLRGNGCVPIDGLMEDAATAEISRAQIWQWLHHRAELDDGRVVDPDLVHDAIAREAESLVGGQFDTARKLFEDLCLSTQLPEFLTSYAYDSLLGIEDPI